MVANAVNTSAGNLPLTLIDGYGANGFTGYIYEGYEYSDQALFVGIDPGLGDDDYPSGCALMMQYQRQTFLLQWTSSEEETGTENSNSNSRDDSFQNTTSCTGLLDLCSQSVIIEIIRSFRDDSNNTSNSTSGSKSESGDRWQSSWIANFMNVTGGPLPDGNANNASDERLGNDQCSPVLPQSDWNLYKVADMRLFYFVNAPDDKSVNEFYSPVFGGRAGFTPVMTVLYTDGGQNDNENGTDADPEVQFTCMKTFHRDGEPRQEPFGSGAVARPRGSLSFSGTLLVLVSIPFGL
ncbi:uncharacterized protein DSM5745_08406 [Aspergillus mulundensis]|uniref:Uncharacterized protein n=1 Tax=Aspergillus mulundensis TaxID=1810919 RepID=A0A3D8RA41_9EURO|nr:hypothetical protein DSM5745_08406 [Aspergillus mulundensis]RDW70895.1 hypothetical protein DSM5745_08406 [Aspergillus mulundensis]